eukprot:1567895-Prymnesium_polylepis.1
MLPTMFPFRKLRLQSRWSSLMTQTCSCGCDCDARRALRLRPRLRRTITVAPAHQCSASGRQGAPQAKLFLVGIDRKLQGWGERSPG